MTVGERERQNVGDLACLQEDRAHKVAGYGVREGSQEGLLECSQAS